MKGIPRELDQIVDKVFAYTPTKQPEKRAATSLVPENGASEELGTVA